MCIYSKTCKDLFIAVCMPHHMHGVPLHILCKSVFINCFAAKKCGCGDMLKVTSREVNIKKALFILAGTYCGSCCKLFSKVLR